MSPAFVYGWADGAESGDDERTPRRGVATDGK